MLDDRDFGVKAASDFHEKYITQGRWTRCLNCMRDVAKNTHHVTHPPQTSNTTIEETPPENAPQEAAGFL